MWKGQGNVNAAFEKSNPSMLRASKTKDTEVNPVPCSKGKEIIWYTSSGQLDPLSKITQALIILSMCVMQMSISDEDRQ